MKAYNLAMAYVFICCGFAITSSLGVFHSMTEQTTVYNQVGGIIGMEIHLGILTISGSDLVIAIAAILLVGTAIVLYTQPFSAQGVAYVVFSVIFWTAYGTAYSVMWSLRDAAGNPIPGVGIFWGIFTIVGFFTFIIALVQMPTGGQQSHV